MSERKSGPVLVPIPQEVPVRIPTPPPGTMSNELAWHIQHDDERFDRVDKEMSGLLVETRVQTTILRWQRKAMWWMLGLLGAVVIAIVTELARRAAGGS